MPNLLPLAHGAWGYWDEILPILLVAGVAAVLVVIGFVSRQRHETSPDIAAQSTAPNQTDSADHYRLD